MQSLKLWSTAEIAEYLGVSRRAAEYQIAQPGFPRAIRIGEGLSGARIYGHYGIFGAFLAHCLGRRTVVAPMR